MPNQDKMLSRRKLLRTAAVLGAGVTLAPGRILLAQSVARRRTPGETMGPFYPVTRPLDQDADLTLLSGRSGRAQGKVIHLTGRVLNGKGEPVAGVRVEVWQANTHGRYAHPSDNNPAPLDANFQGFGVQVTDAEGRYRFKTIKPGPYPADGSWVRPPHIHFDVTGKVNRLTTQMYFPGEPLNEKDRLLQRQAQKDVLIAQRLPPTPDVEPDAEIAVWDIMLDKG